MLLYKYYPCDEWTYKSLAIKALWCDNALKQNDPFECLATATITFDESELKSFKDYCTQSHDRTLRNLSRHDLATFSDRITLIRNEFAKRYAFCSLTEKPDEILMWSHYGNRHSGIVLGLDIDIPDHHLQKVTYSTELKPFDLLEWGRFMDDRLTNEEAAKYMVNTFSHYSQKATCWSSEQEWRIWRSEPGYYRYQVDQVKEVYFGVNCSPTTRAVVLKLLDYLPKEFENFGEMVLLDKPVRLGIKK